MKLVHSPAYRTCRLWVPAALFSAGAGIQERLGSITEHSGGCTQYSATGHDRNSLVEEVLVFEWCAFEPGQKQRELRDLVTALAQDLIYEFGEDSAMYDAGVGPYLITQEG